MFTKFRQPSRKNSSSKYKGVIKRKNSFEAQIRVNKKYYYLGNFDTEIKAARAYDNAVDELLDGNGYKNFPKKLLLFCDDLENMEENK